MYCVPTDPNEIDPLSLSASHLQDLLGVEEHQRLDFKESLSLARDGEKLEFLRDVVAMTNGGGGYFIYGAQENDRAQCSGFKSVDDSEIILQAMNQVILDGIAERITGHIIKTHEVGGKKIVTLYLPPESPQRPYMVVKDKRSDFWCRYGKDKRSMSAAEIRSMFQGDTIERRLDQIEETLRRLATKTSAEAETAQQEALVKETGRIQDLTNPAILRRTLRESFRKRLSKERPSLFRISLTPTSPRKMLSSANEAQVRQLIEHPPLQRYGGWNVGGLRDIRRRQGALTSGDDSHYELVVWENGAIEFINDVSHLGWAAEKFGVANHIYFHPYPLIEYLVSFVRLAKAIYDVLGYVGDLLLEYEIVGIEGAILRPYSPKAWGFMRESRVLEQEAISALHEGSDFGSAPDSWAFEVAKDIYHAFGYDDSMVPFFDKKKQAVIE